MIESIRDGVIERHEKPMPKNYWLRNKKTHLDLKHDLPFAMERQLEDQRFQIENNRNPQLYKLYPHDKLRSDVISSQKGAVRSVAVKANVINKIVREVSGVHNYTIVPPPKAKYSLESEKDLVKKEFMDPSTNPRVKVYANEAKLKPKVCSFGHRPRSASRTFHPSTMKFKLRHGEVVSANPSDGSNGNKSRVGLPVAVLAKVLKAPRLYRPGEEMQEIEEQDRAEMERQQQQQQQAQTSKHFLHSYDSNSVENNNSYGNNEQKDYSDLFFSKEEEKEIFTVGQASHRSWDGNTSIASMDSKRKNMKKNNKNKKLDPLENRPAWDEAHHVGMGSNAEYFKLKSSGLSEVTQMSVVERLNRFKSLSVGVNQKFPFCDLKQETDKMIMTGNVPPVRVPTPPKHVPLYYDPLNVPLAMVKEHHKEVVREKEEKIKAKEYQQKLDTIPIVPYHPGTKLKQIKEVTRNKKGKKSVEKEYDLFSFEHKAEVVHDSDTPLGDYTNKFDSAESPYTAEIRKSRSAKSSSFGRSGLNSPGFQSYLENISKSMMEEGLLPIDSQQINGLYNADDFGENQDATRKDSPTESFVELDDYDSINSPPLEAHPPISKHYSTGQLLVQSTIDSGTTQKPKSQPGRIESTSEEKIVEEADNYHADGANQDYYGQDLEEGLMAAMEAARNGDKEALYNFHIRMVKQGSANPFGMDWN